MSNDLFIVVAYLVVSSGARIRGIFRRWQQPVLRGPEWFFNVHVRPDFFAGEGHKILRGYRLRMLMPVAIEVIIATAIFLSGHFQNLAYLMLGIAVLIHVNHVFNVDAAERKARSFAVAEAEEPVSSVVLSLKSRRLRDYSNPKLELAIAVVTVGVFAWLVRYYLGSPEHHNFRMVFALPLFLLYVQFGYLFVKQIVVAWRTPVPQAGAEEHLKAREERRKLYLKTCDISRVSNVAALLIWPVFLSISPTKIKFFLEAWLGSLLAVSIVLTIWQEIRRKQVLALALRTRPAKLPDLLGDTPAPNWPVCYQPSAPMLVLKGARGYSLNLANTLAQMGAAYLAGLGILMAVLFRTTH